MSDTRSDVTKPAFDFFLFMTILCKGLRIMAAVLIVQISFRPNYYHFQHNNYYASYTTLQRSYDRFRL